jgi:hypothetical protein
MGYTKHKAFLALGLALLPVSISSPAQQGFYSRLRSRNGAMTQVQPAWMGPLIQSDARLSQAVRVSVSNAGAPGAQILSYGNNHGVSFLGGTRFQFDFNPPSYFRNHSAALPDGFGNAFTQVKYRIASGNADHGNFALTAIVGRAFGGGYAQNGMVTGFYCPKIAAGKGFGRFDAQSSISALLPTGKIEQQGRVLEWNTTAQFHTTAHTWFDAENNAAYFSGGNADGKVQNFLTPAAFYMIRRRDWPPAHSVIVFNAGMQIATSRFHTYNHNLITEMRILF